MAVTDPIIRTEITGIGDPFVLRHGKEYFLYATSAPDGFKVFRSRNLTDWEDCGYCYRNSLWGENNFWAPEAAERDGKFWLFFTAREARTHSLRLGAAVADSPLGPFRDVSDHPTYDFGYASIDCSLFTDDDGKNYLYFVKDCSENILEGVHTSQIYVVPLKDNLIETCGEPVLLTTPDVAWEKALSAEWRWNEGPAVIKHGGVYYLCYSVNCFDSREYCVGYATADSPLGPFVKAAENPILSYVEGEISGPGHNHFFETVDGRLMTAFHIHTDYDRPSGDRRACFAEVTFPDGKLTIHYCNRETYK